MWSLNCLCKPARWWRFCALLWRALCARNLWGAPHNKDTGAMRMHMSFSQLGPVWAGSPLLDSALVCRRGLAWAEMERLVQKADCVSSLQTKDLGTLFTTMLEHSWGGGRRRFPVQKTICRHVPKGAGVFFLREQQLLPSTRLDRIVCSVSHCGGCLSVALCPGAPEERSPHGQGAVQWSSNKEQLITRRNITLLHLNK